MRSFLLVVLITLFPSLSLSDEVTAEAQRLLNELGYNAGPVDGLIGGKTKSALKEFYLLSGDTFDGNLNKNEIMDLSIAAKKIMPSCSISNSPTLIEKNNFFEILFNKIENSLHNSKYFPNYTDTRYGDRKSVV